MVDPAAGLLVLPSPLALGPATSLALSILAGRGFDSLAGWPKAGRALRWFSMACLAGVLSVVLLFELSLLSSARVGGEAGVSGFDRALKFLPWSDMPEEKSFGEIMAEARRPPADLRALMALARPDNRLAASRMPTLEGQRFAIYGRELGEAGALLLGLFLAGGLASRPRAFAASLLAIALVDPIVLARHRPFDLGPARPLIEQSPRPRHLAKEPRGLARSTRLGISS